MQVPTIRMKPEEAQRKLEAYRGQLHQRADTEYAAAAQGYKAMAEGKILLDLDEVFATVPLDEKSRPKLAIARADRKEVHFVWEDNRFTFDASLVASGRVPRGSSLRLNIGAGGRKQPVDRWGNRGFAVVPMIPADVRPNVDLRKVHVLWEVEQWADSSKNKKVSRDPYLVQHLAGALWVVLAEWNLTPLELAITRGREP